MGDQPLEAGTRASLTGYALFVLILFIREDLVSALFGLRCPGRVTQ